MTGIHIVLAVLVLVAGVSPLVLLAVVCRGYHQDNNRQRDLARAWYKLRMIELRLRAPTPELADWVQSTMEKTLAITEGYSQ